MSSNLKITKQCEWCKQLFIAKKITTKFCSHRCASLSYKAQKRKERENSLNKSLCDKLIISDSPTLYQEVVLRPQNVAKILQVSMSTIYRYLKNGTIKNVKIGNRVYIHKSEIDKLLNVEKLNKMEDKARAEPTESKELITVKEIASTSGYSHQKIYRLIYRHNLQSVFYKGDRYYIKSQVENVISPKDVE
ncbi:MAG: helix-turn-helix domain-containing protein [Rikenellaceae bacterium]